jgi:hypothetical protein
VIYFFWIVVFWRTFGFQKKIMQEKIGLFNPSVVSSMQTYTCHHLDKLFIVSTPFFSRDMIYVLVKGMQRNKK